MIPIKFLKIPVIIVGLLFLTLFYYLNYYPGTQTVIHHNRNDTLPAGSSNSSPLLKTMTYNINFSLYKNSAENMDEIAALIKSTEANLIALNEIEYRRLRTNLVKQVEHLAEQLDMNYVYGPNLKTGTGSYGNALLTEYPILEAYNIRLPWQLLKEPRGLLYSQLLMPDKQILHVYVTHLATSSSLRQRQLQKIEEIINNIEGPTILMGDFNQPVTELGKLKTAKQSRKTFPEHDPAHAIDLIFTSSDLNIINLQTINTDQSDHLPLVASLTPVNPPVHAAVPD